MQIVAGVKNSRRLPFERGTGTDLLEIVRTPRSDIPAVTHVDYSARIQTICPPHHAEYYDVVRCFAETTGCDVIVNTSFNVRAEPIVCTPYDAYRCFMRTEMDALFLGNYLLEKDGQPPWLESTLPVASKVESEIAATELQLRERLKKIYRKRFSPLKETAKPATEEWLAFSHSETTWSSCSEGKIDRTFFEIPPELDGVDGDPERMARVIVGYWKSGPITRPLQRVVALTLKLYAGQSMGPESPEALPDSVYAMF